MLFTFLLSVVIKVQVTIVGTEVLFQCKTIDLFTDTAAIMN